MENIKIEHMAYRAEQFIKYTKGASQIKEFNADLMLKTLDHISVFEEGTLVVIFLDDTEVELR